MNMLSRRGFIAGLGAAALAPALVPAVAHAEQVIPALVPSAPVPPALPQIDGTIAYTLIDPATGAVLAEHLGDMPLAPASTLKTITALYALNRLGPDHRFTTRVIRAGNTLILAGGGDPVLDSDALADLAARVAEAEKTSGRPAPTSFMVWGGALPRVAQLDPQQAAHLPYNPTVSGMILNFNRVHLGWRRGDKGPQLSLQARGAKVSPRAYTVAISAVDRGLPLFDYGGTAKLESWTVSRASLGRSGSRWLPVRRPELYAGDVFQTLCRARGLVLPNPGVIELLPEGTEIARHDSPALRQIVTGMMEFSTNLTAEVIGLAASGAPDIPASARAMEDWLRGQGIAGGYAFHDHSGLAAGNVITSAAMAQAIARLDGAVDLRGTMKHIPLRDAKGKRIDSPIRIEAKTGTLNFVSNLAGYAQRDAGRSLVFAIFEANPTRMELTRGQELPDGVIGWTKRAKAVQQEMIEGWFAQGLDIYHVPALSDLPDSAPERALLQPVEAAPYQINPAMLPGTGIFR